MYSTCSVNQFENESLVSWALQKFPSLQLANVDSEFGSAGWATAGLSTEQLSMVRRFGPPAGAAQEVSLHNSIGFFIAKFHKTQ